MRHAILVVLGALLFGAGLAHAANDTWATRTPIAALPFQAVDPNVADATRDASDPETPCIPAGADPLSHTVWFSYTTGANTEYVTVDARGNSYLALVAVYTGAPGGFRIETGGCGSGNNFNIMVGVPGLRLAPHTEYSFLVGVVNTNFAGGTLTFNLRASALYQVTKIADTNDGACDSDCSLREAIGAANANPGAVLIPAGHYTVTLPGVEDANAGGDFDLACGMGVYGAGMDTTTIDANTIDVVLDFDRALLGTCTLTLGDLTLTGGRALTGASGEMGGGGLRMPLGAHYPDADFIGLERVRITGNQAALQGGGAQLIAPAVIRDSRFDNNGFAFYGGGLAYLHNSYGFLDISGTTFDDNDARQDGGGLYLQGGSGRIVNSTFSNNHATHAGAGFIFDAAAGTLFVGSSTIANNNTTNMFTTGAGAGVRLESGAVTMINSIVANNVTANGADPPDCALGSATLGSHHDLVRTPDASCVFAGTGDVTGVDPVLAATLAAHGGPTPTLALSGGSPAVDTADPAGCVDASGIPLAHDQRGAGFPRTLGAACDKGAYELGAMIFANGFE